MSISKSKIFSVIVALFAVTTLYFAVYGTNTENKNTGMTNAKMPSYQLPEDGPARVTFQMPGNYTTFEKGLPDSLSFRADTYTVESVSADDAKQEQVSLSSDTNSFIVDVDVPGTGLKRCIKSSNGMSVNIQMIGGLDLLPPEESIKNGIAINEISPIDIATSTEMIDGYMLLRSEQVQPECEYSYAINYVGNVDGYLAQFNFRFEGDYSENLAVIERVIESINFELEK